MAHRVELLVIAAEFTGVVTAGRDLGAQREHQHADGGQPHEDTPWGRGTGKRRRQGWTSVDPTLRSMQANLNYTVSAGKKMVGN